MIESRKLGKVDGIEIRLAESSLAGKFTEAELADAWALVDPKPHWKGPIDAVIPATAKEVVAAAIEHFTGTSATFERAPGIVSNGGGCGLLRVTAPGYWAGPCN